MRPLGAGGLDLFGRKYPRLKGRTSQPSAPMRPSSFIRSRIARSLIPADFTRATVDDTAFAWRLEGCCGQDFLVEREATTPSMFWLAARLGCGCSACRQLDVRAVSSWRRLGDSPGNAGLWTLKGMLTATSADRREYRFEGSCGWR